MEQPKKTKERSQSRDSTAKWSAQTKKSQNIESSTERERSSETLLHHQHMEGTSRTEFPDKLTVNGEIFENDQVMKGFSKVAEEQAQQEGMYDTSPNPTYVNMKVHNYIYRKILRHGHRKIKQFTYEEIIQAVKSLPGKKAQDIYGIAKENLAWLSEKSKSMIYPMIGEMLGDPRLYSSTMNNMSVASYLYKGKKKPRDSVSSYRKISIGTTMSKTADALMAPTTQAIAKKSQQGTQFGFTENLNYLMCGLLRETLVRRRQNRGEKSYILAVDVRNAFSTTAREAQLYELKQAGETDGIWIYSDATYQNTWTVLKQGSKYSNLIQERRGSRQGAKKSAVDYKVYNKPLHNMLTDSNLGVQECDLDLGSQMVADDSLNINGKIEEVEGSGEIYTAFSNIYHVEFCYNKTILNVIGTKEDKKELEQSKILIGGVKPNYDEESIHIGLVMNEDLSTTGKRNVQERIKKTDKVLYGFLREIMWSDTKKGDHPDIDVRKKLYESIIRPRLLSGLNVFNLKQEEIKELTDLEKDVLRAMMNVRDKSQ